MRHKPKVTKPKKEELNKAVDHMLQFTRLVEVLDKLHAVICEDVGEDRHIWKFDSLSMLDHLKHSWEDR